MSLVELFDEKLSSDRVRPEDIPNDVMAQESVYDDQDSLAFGK